MFPCFTIQSSLLLRRILNISVILLVALKVVDLRADANDGFISGDQLVLPVVVVGDSTFTATFSILEAGAPPELELTGASELFEPNTEGASFLDGSLLTIPRISIDGTILRAELGKL